MSKKENKENFFFDQYLDEYNNGLRSLDSLNKSLELITGPLNKSYGIVQDRYHDLESWINELQKDWNWQVKAMKVLRDIQQRIDFEDHIHSTDIFIKTSYESIEELYAPITDQEEKVNFIKEANYWIDLIGEKGVEICSLRCRKKALERLIKKIEEEDTQTPKGKELTYNEMREIADKRWPELLKKGYSENQAAEMISEEINRQRAPKTIKNWMHPEYLR